MEIALEGQSSRSGGGRLVEQHHEGVADHAGQGTDGDRRQRPTREVAVGIRKDHGDECDEGQVREDEPDRNNHQFVELGQRGDEPEVAGGREQRAGEVVGMAPQRHEPCRDEREPRRDREPGCRPGACVVMARNDEGGRRGGLDDHERGRNPKAQRPHLQFTRSVR